MAHVSNKADNFSRIALSTLSTRVNRSSSYDLNLVGLDWEVGLPVPIKHKWYAIGHDINSQDLEKMVLEMTKNV